GSRAHAGCSAAARASTRMLATVSVFIRQLLRTTAARGWSGHHGRRTWRGNRRGRVRRVKGGDRKLLKNGPDKTLGRRGYRLEMVAFFARPLYRSHGTEVFGRYRSVGYCDRRSAFHCEKM